MAGNDKNMLRSLLIILIPLKLSFFLFAAIIGVMGFTFEVLTQSKISKVISTVLFLPAVIMYRIISRSRTGSEGSK